MDILQYNPSMKKAGLLSFAFVGALLFVSCVNDSIILPDEFLPRQETTNLSVFTKVEMDSVYYYHESTNLVLKRCLDSRFIEYDNSNFDEDNTSGYALRIIPRSFIEQKQIEQYKGIKVSYIPFGYEPIYLPERTDTSFLSLIPLPSDTREVYPQSDSNDISPDKLPSLYVEWPKELALPNNLDYNIMYLIAKQADQQRIVYPHQYWLVFQTLDTVLFSNIRLKNLKIRVSKNGTTISEQLTDAQGRIKITSDQASYDSEPLTYSITAVTSSPKWTITREISNSTPIHRALGTLSQYFDTSNPLDTIYISLSSLTSEFEIHRAIDYYRNDSHELSSSILSAENSLRLSASDSTTVNSYEYMNGYETWDTQTNSARIVIYNNPLWTRNLMGVILHEIGHARKDYAQGATYNSTNEQKLFHDSYASFIGFYLGRKYYIDKGLSISPQDLSGFNSQHRQYWTEGRKSPLFIDLFDDFNQHSHHNIYVDDTITDVPIQLIDQLGAYCNSFSDLNTNISPLIGVYFTQSQWNTMLSYY